MIERAFGFCRGLALIFILNFGGDSSRRRGEGVFHMLWIFHIFFFFELVRNSNGLRTHQSAVRIINAKHAGERTSHKFL